jgi:hypothetical protein
LTLDFRGGVPAPAYFRELHYNGLRLGYPVKPYRHRFPGTDPHQRFGEFDEDD